MKKYRISFWPTTSIDRATPETADMWRDLGITLAMSPSYGDRRLSGSLWTLPS